MIITHISGGGEGREGRGRRARVERSHHWEAEESGGGGLIQGLISGILSVLMYVKKKGSKGIRGTERVGNDCVITELH